MGNYFWRGYWTGYVNGALSGAMLAFAVRHWLVWIGG